MSREVGDRVAVFTHATPDEVYLLGYGAYQGYQPVIADAVGFICEAQREINAPGTCLQLDDGRKVYGSECWWCSATKAEEWIRGRKVVPVDLDEFRAKHRSTEGEGERV